MLSFFPLLVFFSFNFFLILVLSSFLFFSDFVNFFFSFFGFCLFLSFCGFFFCFNFLNTPFQLTGSTLELPLWLLSHAILLWYGFSCHTNAEGGVCLFTQLGWFLLTQKLGVVTA